MVQIRIGSDLGGLEHASLLIGHVVSEQMLHMFPLNDIPSMLDEDDLHCGADTDRLRSVQQSLILQDPDPADERAGSGKVLRAGELYKRYRTETELPTEARAFFELAGMLYCLNVHDWC